MPLGPGTRLGSYDILSAIGAGGMGEVYRARDSRLDRNVALKVLKESFAADPDRVARFDREAKTLAALNHPHIAHLYGLEQAGTVSALVMELVEGDDLSRRLLRGALPIDEALAVARQIADALEAAHEQGIVHRDLKPSNIKLRTDGVVKLLDFGLAKALARDESAVNLSHTSTVTIDGTRAGAVLGTAAYMSPEQARGKPIDKRTDVWAFGCVLYEMLTGRTAFGGETASDTVAKILEREPDWSSLPASTPPRIRLLIQRCLQKDVRRRLRDIGDARLDLEPQDDDVRPPAQSRTTKRAWLTPAAIGLLAGLALASAVLLTRRAPAAALPVSFAFTPPPALSAFADGIGLPVPSPDGRQLAFVATDAAGRSAVWVRRIDSTAAQPIAGSEGATEHAFWSPDGRFIGFLADGKLKKVQASGGPAVTICSSPGLLGAAWGADDIIIYSPINRSPLNRVSASGGTPEAITTLNEGRKENSHRFPAFLPDGRRFLFTARSDVKENNLIYLGSIDSREVSPVIAAQSQARYTPPGNLLFTRDGTLMAQPFDVKTAALSGEAVPLASPVRHNTPSSSSEFAVSADGSVLIYSGDVTENAEVAWYTRDGRQQSLVARGRQFTDIRISPDERLAATVIPDSESGNRDVWILGLPSGSLTRLTSNPANDWQPAWSSDSRQIAFATDREGRSTVYRTPAEGGGEELLLRLPDRGAFPNDWSSDGRYLTLNITSSAGVASIWGLPLAGDRTPFPLNQPASPGTRELTARLSPDGRWVAYESNESGSLEVYVKPFSRPGKVRVSREGGNSPRWRADGRELFFREPGGDVMAAAVQPGEPFEAASPVRLFKGCARPANSMQDPLYDVARDGKRFLMICRTATTTPPVTVSVGWNSALQR